MEQFLYIQLTGTRRQDDSVFITSPDLPMFSVVGKSEQSALDLAFQLLPEYLRANVPEFVDLRSVPSAISAMPAVTEGSSERSSTLLPAHVIARMNRKSDDHSKGGGSKKGPS